MKSLFHSVANRIQAPRHVMTLLTWTMLMVAIPAIRAQSVSVVIQPGRILNTINPKIYGQFLEHIYHSADNGLWGQIIWNRSFEQGLPRGAAARRSALDARFWSSYGTGKVQLSTNHPRNGWHCVTLTASGGQAGIEQSGICLRYAGGYHGSFWIRGAAPAGLTVRILNGTRVLYQHSVAAASKTWRKVHFTFTTARPARRAVLQIALTAPGTASIDQVSLMSDPALKLGGFRPDTFAAVKALKPTLIRFPGGGYADGYQWKREIGPRADRAPQGGWNDMDPNDMGTDEFMTLCQKVGAAPELCVDSGPANANARTLEHFIRQACQWLEYCNSPVSNKWGALRAKYGHPKSYNVKYWEIGNEVWYFGYKPKPYARALAQFAKAMKTIDPSIRIIACGSGGLNLKWNRDIVDSTAARDFYYLDLHQYVWPPAYLQGARDYLNFIRKTGAVIKKCPNPEIKLFVGEWNEQTIDWRTGIFAGVVLTGFERQGSLVRMASPALFLRWTGIPAKDWNNAFINFSRRSWFPAPNYVVEKFWRDHYAKYRVAATNVAGLEADATLTANHHTAYYKAVNTTNRPIQLTLKMGRTFPLGAATAQTIAPGSQFVANSLRHPNKVHVQKLQVSIHGQDVTLTLAKYAATVVTMRRGQK